MSTDPDKPKLIIDEDWKTQVQAEREAAKKKAQEGDEGDEADKVDEGDSTPAGEEGEIPPASFVMLVTTIATQAMVSMGLVPVVEGEQPMVRLDIAKHHIDTLGILEQKTKGNLDQEETALLTDALHQLRMTYLAVANAGSAPPQPE